VDQGGLGSKVEERPDGTSLLGIRDRDGDLLADISSR
jgi:hypothetical protein